MDLLQFSSLEYLIYGGIFSLIVLIIMFLVVLTVTTGNAIAVVDRYPSEATFVTEDSKKEFPFYQEKSECSLSVVVPAYNEEERLPVMLDETLAYLEDRQKSDPAFSFEIIIVDDGSKDKTTQVGLAYGAKHGHDKIRVLTLHKNRGKGGAVRLGIFSSRGEKVLFVDADGATKFSDLDNVEKGLDSLEGGKEGMAVSVGSRAHLQEQSVAERSLFRTILMHGFHFLVWFLCVKDVKDTQCGFKLFTRKAALRLFSSLHVERWAFDVELLYIAQCLGIPIAEKAVNWQEIDGSKMIPVFSWLQMGRDLLLIRLRYMLGLWKISTVRPEIITPS